MQHRLRMQAVLPPDCPARGQRGTGGPSELSLAIETSSLDPARAAMELRHLP
jgi:hypothetical protein